MKAPRQYNIHEAKIHFSKLIERAHNGEEIIISQAGEPLVRLVPIGRLIKKRVPGTATGFVQTERNLEAPLPKKIRKLFLSYDTPLLSRWIRDGKIRPPLHKKRKLPDSPTRFPKGTVQSLIDKDRAE